MDIEITYQYDSELDEIEAEQKGYRSGIIVKAHGKTYILFAITMQRLQQDFERAIETMGYHCPDRNTIIVPETTKAQIEHTIKKLYQGRCFETGQMFLEEGEDRETLFLPRPFVSGSFVRPFENE